MELLVVALLLFISSSNAAEVAMPYSSLVDAFALEQNPCESIRNGQFICKDCRTLAFCAQKESGWEAVTIGTCSDSLYCDEEVHGCTHKMECQVINRGPRFQCQNPGIYPDPYECKYYHECNASNQDERKVCPSGTAYSPRSKTCSLKTSDTICSTPQYECHTFGHMAAWPSDENIYYVCSAITIENGQLAQYPRLYRCPDDQVFKNNRCISVSVKSPPSPSPSPSPLPSTTPTPSPPSPSPSPSTCSSAGSFVPDTNDRHSYFVCQQGQFVKYTCPGQTYYDETLQACRF